MTRWLNKLEYRFRRFGIDNLIIYITGTMLAIYLAENVTKLPISALLSLDMARVLRGEVWRLITFVVVPRFDMILWVLLELYFYYWIGSSLENTWGTTKFTLFYVIGIIGAIIAAIITGYGTNRFLNLSMFLALAALDPNREILLWMVIPVKMKILALIDIVFIALMFFSGGWSVKASIIASLLNLILFFGDNLLDWLRNYKKYGAQRRNFRKSMKRNRDMYGN